MPKTPDVIKKGLQHCIEGTSCRGCPYCEECAIASNCNPMHEDLQGYIRQLEATAKTVEQIRWERDIAIGQLKELGFSLGEKCDSKIPCWISVNERLPKEHADGSVDAVIVTDGEFIHMAYYAHGQWIFCESGEMKEPMWNTVTHWMPLPPMPKEET